MEPMTLGSPTHSPSGSPGASFLPSYLMGEFNPPTTPRTGSLSPTKGRTLAFGNSPLARPSPQAPPQAHYSTPLRQKPANNVSFSNKASGPPTLGLFDTINQSDYSNRNMQSPTGNIASPSQFTSPSHMNHYQQQDIFNNSEIHSPLSSYPQNQNFHKNQSFSHQPTTHPQLSNNDSYSQNMYNDVNINGNSCEDEYWITVFGFPPSAASIILTQFSNCGNIAEKKFPPVGNWVWLRFGSRIEAGRALALNGRIFSGGVMIGVLPCSQSPNNTNTPTIRSGARQLAVGPSRLQNSSAVSPIATAGPGAQRSSGAISRALEYVFGW